ncbi:hypothetical protein ACIXIP_05505 [Bacteroides fragilis]
MAALDRDCRKRNINSCSKERRRRGTCRLRIDRNGAPHREAVIVRPGKGNERKSQRRENGKNRTCPQSGGTPCANERLLQKVVAQPKEKV